MDAQLGLGAAGSGGPHGRPPQRDKADEPDDGDDVERVAAGSEHPWPEQVELDDDDLGDVAETEVRTAGWLKLSIRIDMLPGWRRSWSMIGGNQMSSGEHGPSAPRQRRRRSSVTSRGPHDLTTTSSPATTSR